MSKKNISQEKIIQAFISSAFEKSAGATSLSDISEILEIKKASLYNHFESRDSMYEATLEFCSQEIAKAGLLQENSLEQIKSPKCTLSSFFKKQITHFFEIYENEPLFQMYVFVHSEQYFNLNALNTVQKEVEKLCDEVKTVLKAFADCKKIKNKTEKELRELSSGICNIILQQRDLSIAARKETVRQNPESGVGSLFALPADEASINRTLKMLDFYLKDL